MKYFIDTNIFLRTLVKDDEKAFADCVALLEKVKNGHIKAYTTSLNLAELVWTLLSFYKFPKQKVTKAANSILNLSGLKIVDKYNHRYAMDLYEKNNVKYIDTVIASIKELTNKTAAIISYDKDFDKLNVVRKEPDDILKSTKQ